MLAVSLMALDEIIVSFRGDRETAIDLLRTALTFCNFSFVIKPPEQMLRETILGFLSGEQLSPSFEPDRAEVVALSQFLSSSPTPEDLGPLIDEIDLTKSAFYEGMLEANERTRKEMGIENGKLPGSREGRTPTFDQYMQAIAPHFAGEALERVGVEEPVDQELLCQVPAVRAYARISASWIYSQVIENRKLRASDGYDMRHLVQASATNGLVTHDAQFGRLVERIGLPAFSVMDLQTLLDS